MIIVGGKDYYDYMPNMYGRDEKIVLNRNPFKIKPPEIFAYSDRTFNTIVVCGIPIYYKSFSYNEVDTPEAKKFQFEKLFKEHSYKPGTNVLFSSDDNNLDRKLDLLARFYQISGKLYQHQRLERFKSDLLNDIYKNQKVKDYFVDFSKKYNRPIFKLESMPKYKSKPIDEVSFDHTTQSFVPTHTVLSNYGFASVYPAEQMYQKLSCFIGQMLVNNEPPVVVSDSVKITAHGFDIKQSFRKRK